MSSLGGYQDILEAYWAPKRREEATSALGSPREAPTKAFLAKVL
jgi:hypothetical protein